MITEDFAKGTSFLHKRDSKGKIIASIAFIGVTAATSSFLTAGCGLLLAGIMTLAARLPIKKVGKRLLLVNSFTLLLWLVLPFSYGDGSTALLWSLPVSKEGITLASLITLKTNAIVLYILAFLSTSTIASIGHGLQKLGLPDRLSFLLLFSYRNIQLIYNEYRKLLFAATMRNFSPGTNMHTYRTFAYLFGMTLVKSWNRGERIHEAMLMRGFTGELHPLNHSKMNRNDLLFLGVNLLLSLALFCLNSFN